MPRSMRALVAGKVGEPTDVLRLETRPVPTPEAGQALIRVKATPIHASDLHVLRGRYGFSPRFPTVGGHMECVGRIEDLGPNTKGLKIGERVVAVAVPAIPGPRVAGTWQEYLVADMRRLLRVPDHLSDSSACQLAVNPLTALLLVTRELDVQPGEWLLQTAAGSTVGRLVIQLSRHLGIRTINVVRRREAVEEIETLGGDEVICTADEDLTHRVAEIAGPGGVRKAIDCVAGVVGAQVSQALAPGGEVVVYGALSTHRQTDSAALTMPLQARSVIYETKAVRGFWLNRWFGAASPEEALRALSQVRALVAVGALSIPQGRPFPLERFTEAIAFAEAPAHGTKPLFVFEGGRAEDGT
ncbi:zinc-dependent alcohol dehydrogenase family protein [Nonomuraea roseoviolacea]|uniref:enoyl-[acyl-carrier-protein] reductase n=1 Tax=Nonomuraea roseoviolacea subsp. carminata TaxID=160689 RepID=A0ABT1JQG3_9ACTN|nr:zinc-dependent alcohol dehydrogenase family protein [Nonomuraea roseoviolacea]MCP2343949.1 NADPH:quinone reductase-like Zn-dependent oxidoreductase [Nonomuraea roseoviolacea subsp. carminata]